jgi:lipopolysaccharide transport system permease protein
MIPVSARNIYYVNPMAGTLLAFRSSLVGEFPFPWVQWGYSCTFSALAFFVGVYVYRRSEVQLMDRL